MTPTTHLFSVLTQTCHNCGVSKADVEGNKVSSMCSKAIHSDTIERVSRAMCEADGNAPDRKVITYALEHLRGRGQGAMYLPEGTVTRFAWELYANLAEAAIQALQETHVMYTKSRVADFTPKPERGYVLSCNHEWMHVDNGPTKTASIKCARCGDTNGPNPQSNHFWDALSNPPTWFSPDQQTKTTVGEWLRDKFPDRMADEREPIVIPSRLHDQDITGIITADCEMKQLELPMSYVFASEYEGLAADILNDPFKQSETNRILSRVRSESEAHALQTVEFVKQPVDFLALNKASST